MAVVTFEVPAPFVKAAPEPAGGPPAPAVHPLKPVSSEAQSNGSEGANTRRKIK